MGVKEKKGRGLLRTFENLEVYRRLVRLHVEVSEITPTFPNYEMYELGSQLRRSSNSAPANIAEGWNSKHSAIYIEGLNRAQGELRETKHHLSVAFQKGYLNKPEFSEIYRRYDECAGMLHRLRRAVELSTTR